MPEINEYAPDFTLPDQDGKDVRLSDFRGKNVLLAFYPFDFSPVCTIEFGCFKQDLSKLNDLDIQVLGISVDSKHCHKEFANKLKLNFPLLSDFGKEVCKLYGTLRKEGFSERAYFIIDRNGIIRFRHVMPAPKDRLENSELIKELNVINKNY
ncbi:redoxin domain-containing protein [Candidatus Woesearchaeota archaeon]|nr:redoxin domain-containing protein [Candidatus Woesearchaeota archaeon]